MLRAATLLFILLSPGILLTIPPVGSKVFASRKTSLIAVLVHALFFFILLCFRKRIPFLNRFEGFSSMNEEEVALAAQRKLEAEKQFLEEEAEIQRKKAMREQEEMDTLKQRQMIQEKEMAIERKKLEQQEIIASKTRQQEEIDTRLREQEQEVARERNRLQQQEAEIERKKIREQNDLAELQRRKIQLQEEMFLAESRRAKEESILENLRKQEQMAQADFGAANVDSELLRRCKEIAEVAPMPAEEDDSSRRRQQFLEAARNSNVNDLTPSPQIESARNELEAVMKRR